MLIDKAHLTALGDKGYLNGPLQDRLAARNDVVLLTPRRKNQRAQLPAALTQAINQAVPRMVMELHADAGNDRALQCRVDEVIVNLR